MARFTSDHDPWTGSDPSARSTDQIPRWFAVLSVAAGAALTVVLLRYAIDLLGLVFIIVLVGFSIRALIDWLTEGDTVSAASIAAVFVGLFGTAIVGLWLFSTPMAARLDQRMPPFVQNGIEWAEDRGWGKRVLLTPEPEVGGSTQREPTTGAELIPTIPADGPRSNAESPRKPDRSQRQAAPVTAPTPSTPARTPPAPAATQPRATATSLELSPRRPVAGFSVQLRAVVQSDTPGQLPDGTVVFWRDTVVLGSRPLQRERGQAVAQLTTLDLPVGRYQLSAQYTGNERFRGSRSAPLPQSVGPR